MIFQKVIFKVFYTVSHFKIAIFIKIFRIPHGSILYGSGRLINFFFNQLFGERKEASILIFAKLSGNLLPSWLICNCQQEVTESGVGRDVQ